MDAREALVQRPDVPDEDVDDIVALAARLQDEDQPGPTGATEAEIADVARELDIAPEYVEAALGKWRVDKRAEVEAEAAAEALALADRAKAKRRRKRVLVGAVIGLLGLLVSSLGLGVIGAAQIRSAHADVAAAEHQLVQVAAPLAVARSKVDVVLVRQAALAPQIAAMAGGDPDALTEIASEVGGDGDIEARLDRSRALGVALARELTAASGSLTEADAQIRLNLQHEVTGTQNRITTETRRYRETQAELPTRQTSAERALAEAVAKRASVDSGLLARLAGFYGLSEARR